jgi:alcohol dehydrogenase
MTESKALLAISNGKSVRENGALARNARETMGFLFTANPCEMSHKDCVSIYEKSYR